MAVLFNGDLHVVQQIADRVAVGETGILVRTRPNAGRYSSLLLTHTRKLLEAEPYDSPESRSTALAERRRLTLLVPEKQGLLGRTQGFIKAS